MGNQNPTPKNQEPQLQLLQHPTKSTIRGRTSKSQAPTNLQLQLQLHQHPKKDTRDAPIGTTPAAVRHQSHATGTPALLNPSSSSSASTASTCTRRRRRVQKGRSPRRVALMTDSRGGCPNGSISCIF